MPAENPEQSPLGTPLKELAVLLRDTGKMTQAPLKEKEGRFQYREGSGRHSAERWA